MSLKEYVKKRELKKSSEPRALIKKSSDKNINKLLKEYRRKRDFNKTPEPYGK